MSCSNESVDIIETQGFELLPPQALQGAPDESYMGAVKNISSKITSSFCDLNPALCQEMDTLYYRSASCKPLILVAEGFTEFDMDVFNAQANAIASRFSTGVDTYAYNQSSTACMNVFVLRTQSNEAGVSAYGYPDVDTFYNVSRGEFLWRLYQMPEDDIQDLRDNLIKGGSAWFQNEEISVAIIVNDGTYAGAGFFTDLRPAQFKMGLSISSLDTEYGYATDLFEHEMGHQYHLDDTYVDPYYSLPGCWRMNVTRDKVNHPIYGGAPYYPGARYITANAWRNSDDKMKGVNLNWGAASRYIIARQLGGFDDDLCQPTWIPQL
jgi:hypothetical protein